MRRKLSWGKGICSGLRFACCNRNGGWIRMEAQVLWLERRQMETKREEMRNVE